MSSAVDLAHPRHDLAVTEADHEVHAHLDPPRDAFDEAHDLGVGDARTGMQSMMRTTPRGDLELGLEHERVVAVTGDAIASSGGPSPGWALGGAIRQKPFSRIADRAAKQAGESKRGRHSQSIEPSRPTIAAVWVSPMTA